MSNQFDADDLAIGDFIFFYGSLNPEISWCPELEFYKYLISEKGDWCAIYTELYRVNIRYPGMIECQSDGKDRHPVRGKLYVIRNDIPERKLREAQVALDEYEGFDAKSESSSLFIRKKKEVAKLPSRRPIQRAWMYIYNRKVDPNSLIPSGIWEPDYAVSAVAG